MNKAERYMAEYIFPLVDIANVEVIYIPASEFRVRLEKDRFVYPRLFALEQLKRTSIHRARILIAYDEPTNTLFIGEGSYRSWRLPMLPYEVRQ